MPSERDKASFTVWIPTAVIAMSSYVAFGSPGIAGLVAVSLCYVAFSVSIAAKSMHDVRSGASAWFVTTAEFAMSAILLCAGTYSLFLASR
jgi:hypothetical protein